MYKKVLTDLQKIFEAYIIEHVVNRKYYLIEVKMSTEIFEKVKKVVIDQLGIEDESTVTPQASFAGDLGADSLDTVELVMAFEEAFGCDIPDEDAEKIATVKDEVSYIEAHQ